MVFFLVFVYYYLLHRRSSLAFVFVVTFLFVSDLLAIAVVVVVYGLGLVMKIFVDSSCNWASRVLPPIIRMVDFVLWISAATKRSFPPLLLCLYSGTIRSKRETGLAASGLVVVAVAERGFDRAWFLLRCGERRSVVVVVLLLHRLQTRDMCLLTFIRLLCLASRLQSRVLPG